MWVYITTFSLFIHRWTFGCFYRLAFVNNAVINLSVQISLQDLVLSVLEEFPEVELLNLKIVLFLIFKGNSMLFSI